MGWFSNIGKGFRSVASAISKGSHEPFSLVKSAFSAVGSISRPIEAGVRAVNNVVQEALKVPILGDAIRTGDKLVNTYTGISPIQAIGTAETILGKFNKLQGKLNEASTVEDFVKQNKGEIKEVLKHSGTRDKLLSLLKNAI